MGAALLPATPLPLCSYAAIFKHAKDELGFCYYLIPCGSKKGQMGSCKVRGMRGWAPQASNLCRGPGRLACPSRAVPRPTRI